MTKGILALLMIVETAFALAAQSPALPLAATEPAFQALLASLRKAANARDAQAIHDALARDFYVERDFGGAYDPTASPVQNFRSVFEFDDSKLRPEYKGNGWKELRRALAPNFVERKRDGQLCLPHGAQDRKPAPHAQLCFRRSNATHWKIAGYIHGGD